MADLYDTLRASEDDPTLSWDVSAGNTPDPTGLGWTESDQGMAWDTGDLRFFAKVAPSGHRLAMVEPDGTVWNTRIEHESAYRLASEVHAALGNGDRSILAEQFFVTTRKMAARDPSGLYGYTKATQRDCEVAVRRLQKSAAFVAARIYRRNRKVADFLTTHSTRADSMPAKILVGALRDLAPRIASMEPLPEEGTTVRDMLAAQQRHLVASLAPVDLGLHMERLSRVQVKLVGSMELPIKDPSVKLAYSESLLGEGFDTLHGPGFSTSTAEVMKLAKVEKDAAPRYGLYGYRYKVARMGLQACSEMREQAGIVAATLHSRRMARHERITGYFQAHSKKGKCSYSKMLLGAYPEASFKLASVQADFEPEAWIEWEKAAAWKGPKITKTLARQIAKGLDKHWSATGVKSLQDIRNALGAGVSKPMSMSDRIDNQAAVKKWKAGISRDELIKFFRMVEEIKNPSSAKLLSRRTDESLAKLKSGTHTAGVPGKKLQKGSKSEFDKVVKSVSGHKKDHDKSQKGKVIVTYTEKGSKPWLMAKKTVTLADSKSTYEINPDYLPGGKRWKD